MAPGLCKGCYEKAWAPVWKCGGCGVVLCEHKMEVCRINGSGYCPPCWRKKYGPAAINKILVKWGCKPVMAEA